jgi:hypothetical protein
VIVGLVQLVDGGDKGERGRLANPGMVIGRRQTSEARARRFMSRSITVIAASEALRAASSPDGSM